MTKLYLVRHGETEFNQKGCYYGWTDCSLTPNGIEQAAALKEAFKEIQYDTLISSDLKRALETARILSCGMKDLTVDQRLRELNFGEWEGKTYQEIMEQHKAHWDLWVEDWLNAKPTGGESIKEMYDRICRFVDDTLKKYENQSLVIVSHNGALRMIAVCLLGLSLDKMFCFNFDHGRYSLLEAYEEHCSIKCINNIE